MNTCKTHQPLSVKIEWQQSDHEAPTISQSHRSNKEWFSASAIN